MSSPEFPCEMICQSLRIGSESFRLWTAKNPDTLLDALADKEADHPDVVDERLPYWAELWPSARVLAEAVMTAVHLPPAPWLELGCGPGLPGLAASRRGLEGLWSDYMPEALRLAAHNAETGGINAPATRLIDWRSPPDDLNVPWILAADVAYEERNFLPLLECFETLLAPGGEIWLAEPGRPVARTFFNMLSTENWSRKKQVQIGDVSVWRLTKKTESN